MIDPLTEILRGIRLDGVEYGRCQPCAPWATLFPSGEPARFHFLASGSAWIQSPDGDWHELKPGDAVLLPRGDGHVIASTPGITPVPISDFPSKSVDGIVNVECPNADARNLLFFAVMKFNLDRFHPLLQLMPGFIRANDFAIKEPSIPSLLESMSREAEMNRVGACGIMARLADVLTATMIRSWVEHGCGEATGWLAALRNHEVGRVLAAVHLDPARHWSVEELASIMGASRSSFAQRFLDIVGETPARYVARTRMQQAHQWLREGQRVASIANKLGYDSEASFSRAYKRIIGTPPSFHRLASRA
ncbi:AraC family transcriptional regulator [Ochrobactrum sp. GPK 3]|jgi:AraC-like DNA-binding protein|uniref:AraC family transcriptional regulator n=1 Tax=Brucella sp. 22210 TaxID=3453892 RepID=UPI000DE4A156